MDNTHHHNGYWRNVSSWQLPVVFPHYIHTYYTFWVHAVVLVGIFTLYCTQLEAYYKHLTEQGKLTLLPVIEWVLTAKMWCNDRLISLSWAAVVDGVMLKTQKHSICNVHWNISGGGGICLKSCTKQTEAESNTQTTIPAKTRKQTTWYMTSMFWGRSSMCGHINCTWTCASHWSNVLSLKNRTLEAVKAVL